MVVEVLPGGAYAADFDPAILFFAPQCDHIVPQGSSLSPFLFNIYVTPLVQLVEELEARIVAYANDTQLLFTWDKFDTLKVKICLTAVFQWLSMAQLKCNEEKSEILLYGNFPTQFRDNLWPAGYPLPSSFSQPVKNLGVRFEENLSFSHHIKKLAGSCFGILKSLTKFLPLLPRHTRETVTRALILSRLDYANALFIGTPDYSLKKLQVVQNAAARLLLNIPIRSSVRQHLRSLHWLPLIKRV